jgi:hypothetical protein
MHCGSRFGLGRSSTIVRLRLRCSVGTCLLALEHSPCLKWTMTNLTLKVDGGGAYEVAVIVRLLHGVCWFGPHHGVVWEILQKRIL